MEEIRCPDCGDVFTVTDGKTEVFCPNCGNKLYKRTQVSEHQKQAELPVNKNKQGSLAQNSVSENKQNSLVANYAENTNNTEEVPVKKKSKLPMIFGIIAAVLCITVAGICIWKFVPRTNDEAEMQVVEENSEIIAISASAGCTACLRADGTVDVIGFSDDRNAANDWTDIVAIASGYTSIAGLKADGTVVCTDSSIDVSDWTDVKSVHGRSGGGILAVKHDGTAVGHPAIEGWSNIVQVTGGWNHIAGLKSDGTVVVYSDDDFNNIGAAEQWTDIVSITSGFHHLVGLKSDGTVVAVGGNSYGQCDVGAWTDIVAVVADEMHTFGIKSDGTVVAVGYNEYGQCDVGDWTDIVAISTSYLHTVGLKSDGTVVAVGTNSAGECDVDDWNK